MDIEEVRDLIQLMIDNDLAELEIQNGEERVALKRRGDKPEIPEVVATAPQVAGAEQVSSNQPDIQPDEDEGLVPIQSPMVGTFYLTSDPESPPYVQVGTEVKPDTVVCIIEAMKVYNEIRAETAGVIEQVIVRNEEAVEFGQTLFLVRPTGSE